MSLLDRLEKSLAKKSDAVLGGEAKDLREELALLRQGHQISREQAHRAVDETIDNARAELNRMLGNIATNQRPLDLGPGGSGGMPHLGRHDSLGERLGWLSGLLQPELHELWHAAIDSATGFSPLTDVEFAAEEERLVSAIRDRETELERRRLVREKAEQDAEHAALLKRLDDAAA